MLLWHLCHLWH